MSARTALPALAVLLLGCLRPPPVRAAELYLITDENGVVTITDNPPASPPGPAQHPTMHQTRGSRVQRGYAPRMDLLDPLIRRVAQRHGLSPALLKAMCVAESGMNPLAVSAHGALGLMQLMPATAAAMSVADPFDPAQSLDGGARILARELERFGDLEQAIAAYNAGPGKVLAAGGVPQIAETLAFVARVGGLYHYFLDERPLSGDPDS